MNSLRLPRSAPELRRLARQAVAWWLGELVALMPDVARRWLTANRAEDLVLTFGKEAMTLTPQGHSGAGPVVVPNQSDGAPAAEWRRERFPASAVRIALAENMLFRCTVELPAAAEASMGRILGHQLERLVPLDPSTLSFVWHISERLTARKTVTVAVTIVRKSSIQQALSCASRLGLTPKVVLVRQANGVESPIWRGTAIRDGGRRRLHRGIEAAALMLCAAAYVADVARLDHQRNILRDRLGPADAQVRAVEALSRQVAAEKAILAAIQARMAAPTPLAVLDELTRRLPMDSSLSEFSFRPERVDITGTASHATALLDHLTPSSMLGDPQFAGPITAAPEGPGEHFQMSVRLRAGKP